MIDQLRTDIEERLEQIDRERARLSAALNALNGDGRPAAVRRDANALRRPEIARAARPRAERAPTRRNVLDFLRREGAATAGTIAKGTGLGRASVSTTLSKLVRSGEVIKLARGYDVNRGGTPPAGEAA